MTRLLVAFALGLLGMPGLAQDSTGLAQLATRDQLRGFEAVGRVDIADGGFCTGTLIAPDLVLTAGHCVLEKDGTPVQAGAIRFRAGLANGAALVEATVWRTVVHADFHALDPIPLDQLQLDVALLQLAEPIPTAKISPFTVALPGSGDEVSVVSYAKGREEVLSWQKVCRALDRQDQLIAFDCDVSFGASGAPVLDRSHYRAKIVSIISAGSSMDGQPIAIGMELPALVEGLKADLRAGRFTSEAAVDATKGLAGDQPAGRRIIIGGGADDADARDTGARFVKP